jgi:hypothetical protein
MNLTTVKILDKWKDDIRIDLKIEGWEGVDWMYLAQDRDLWQAVLNTVMDFMGFINGGIFPDQLSDS